VGHVISSPVVFGGCKAAIQIRGTKGIREAGLLRHGDYWELIV